MLDTSVHGVARFGGRLLALLHGARQRAGVCAPDRLALPIQGYGRARGILLVPLIVVAVTACSSEATHPSASPNFTPSPDASTFVPPSPSARHSGPFVLYVADLDGPTVDVQINGRTVATVMCQLDNSASAPAFTPGPGLALPWQVEVLQQDGSLLLSVDELGNSGPRTILIRGYQAGEFPSEYATGGPPPSGTCSP